MQIFVRTVIAAGVLVSCALAQDAASALSSSNPFYADSALPFHAPPFDRIRDSDYQPALDAGISEQLREADAIANDLAPPSFDNTLVALEKSGQLLDRVGRVFGSVVSANTNPELEKVQRIEIPKMAALQDAIALNPKLFTRIAAVYNSRQSLDPEAKRLVQLVYEDFVHEGANLSAEDKLRLKQINQRISVLQNQFREKLLAATRTAAFTTGDRAALAGLTDSEVKAAQAAAESRHENGYTLLLQNTTQQPALGSLQNRDTRKALFDDSWNRAERGGSNDTRETIAEIAKLRSEKARLLGYQNFAAWRLSDQMAKTPEAALHFLNSLVPPATANAKAEQAELQAEVDSDKGGFQVAAYDWDLYADKLRKAKYDIDEASVRPYFELDTVLKDGVFYAATQLYGITFSERKDIPVYQADVHVFEVRDADGKPLALFYTDYFKRDNKQGGAWTSDFVTESKLLNQLPVVYNVANLPKPAAGEPALISYEDVRTMFHEFGHALHAIFASVEYPTLGGHFPRDFVEFPSQFNEHWRDDPTVFAHYARNYKTGEPMPAELIEKLRKSAHFNQAYSLTEMLSASELDLQWHLLPATAAPQKPDEFEQAALERTKLDLPAVPPRYRSTYFEHVWGGGYASAYYAYLWSEMLDDDAYLWFRDHGGLTRTNGERFRAMVLSKGASEDFENMYEHWRGAPPGIEGLLLQRGLSVSR